MSAPVDATLFRAAMARFPGAVTIVTTGTGPDRRGLTATAVCSVTADPPSLLVCLNRKTGTCAAITQRGHFNVNLLSDEGGQIALTFAGAQGATGEAKFQTGDWLEDARGLPRLTTAVACFSCEVAESVEAGSHTMFIGRIIGIDQRERPALLYEQSRFHRLAPV